MIKMEKLKESTLLSLKSKMLNHLLIKVMLSTVLTMILKFILQMFKE